MGDSEHENEENMQVRLSPVEITYLAKLLGAEMVIGIGDPFYAWLSKDIQEAWDKASSILQEKNYLRFKSGGGPILDVGVAAAMVGFTDPTATVFTVVKDRSKAEDSRVFHLTAVYGVEQTGGGEPWDELTIILHEDFDKTLEKILSISELTTAQKELPGTASANISMDRLWKLISAVDSGDQKALQEILAEVEIKEGNSLFLDTMQGSYRYFGLLGIRLLENSWHLSGAIYIWDSDRLWAGIPEFPRDPLPITFHTVSRDEALNRVKEWFQGLITVKAGT